MEIERKFTIKHLPDHLEQYENHLIEQGYLSTDPVVRVRREDDTYYLTYKGKGLMAREEYNLPLTADSYAHLVAKADGNIITKKRYLIPIDNPKFVDSFHPASDLALTIELDVFDKPFAPMIVAEVEFPDLETANAFCPCDWFLEDVTTDRSYHNSNLSKMKFD